MFLFFQVAPKDMNRDAKLSVTMAAVGWPVLQGGIGTVVATLPLALCGNYIGRVFLKTVILVVCSGLIHGLFFLPLLLVSLDFNAIAQRKQLRKVYRNANA